MSDLFDSEDLIFRMMGQEDLARRVAVSFLEDIPLQMAALNGAAGRGDTESVHASAHALKGAAGSVGSPCIYRLCSRIEAIAGQGGLPLELLVELRIAVEAIRAPVLAFSAGGPDIE